MNAVVETVTADIGTALARPLPTDALIEKRAQAAFIVADGLTVESQSDYDMALEEVKIIKNEWDTMEADRTSFTGPLNTILSRINERFQPRLKLLKQAEALIKGKMTAFLDRQAALQLESRQQAEKTANEEREKLEAQAQALRDAAAVAGTPEAQQAAEEQAAAIEQTAAVVIAQPAWTAAAKGRGVSTPKTLDFAVDDKLALLKFIVEERPDLVVLVEVSDKPMRGLIKMMGVLTKLPGVRVFPKTGLTIR